MRCERGFKLQKEWEAFTCRGSGLTHPDRIRVYGGSGTFEQEVERRVMTGVPADCPAGKEGAKKRRPRVIYSSGWRKRRGGRP